MGASVDSVVEARAVVAHLDVGSLICDYVGQIRHKMKNIMIEELLSGQIILPYYHFIGPPIREVEDAIDNQGLLLLSVTGVHSFAANANEASVKPVQKILSIQVLRYEDSDDDFGQTVVLGQIINEEGDTEHHPNIEIVFDLHRAREGYFIFENPKFTLFENNNPDNWWRNE